MTEKYHQNTKTQERQRKPLKPFEVTLYKISKF